MSVVRTRDQSPQLARPVMPARGPLPGRPGGLSPKDIYRIVLKRIWLILGVWLGIITVTLGATTVWYLTAPLYTEEALLEVSPTERVLLEVQRTPLYNKDVIERYKSSQARLVKHDEVLRAAINDDRIKNTEWYRDHAKEQAIQALDEAISVSNVPNTNYVQISMTSTRKNEIANIINAIADKFVHFSSERTRAEHDKELRMLKDERANLRMRLERDRTDLASAIGTSPMAAMEERRSILSLKLQMLTRSLAEAEDEQARAEATLRHWEDQILKGQVESDFQIQRMLDMDMTLRGLEVQMAELNTRLSGAIRVAGPQHRSVKQIRGLLEATEEQRDQRRKEVIKTQAQNITQIRMMEMEVGTSQVLDLVKRYKLAKADAHELEKTLGKISGLGEQVNNVQGRIRDLDRSILVRELQLRGREGIGPVAVAAYAPTPRIPSHPRWGVMTALGILLGLVVGFGLAFLLELTDVSIKGPADIVRRFDLPLLGVVPHSDDMDEEIEDIRRVVLAAPHSPAAEAFRQIRTNLLFSGPAHQRQSVLVTSPAPEDGRTTVVLNLATSIAQAGRRVLVVDANFRQPAMAEIFPAAAAAGLSSALVGQAAWRDVVSPTDVPNLSVITSGPLPPNPAELFGSEVCRQLIAEMAAEYDQVILDGPPIMLVSDACVLSTQVDGTILVVRAGVTSAGLVSRAVDQLTRVGAHVLGVVLQGIRTTAGGYLRKNYRTFYEYQQKPLP